MMRLLLANCSQVTRVVTQYVAPGPVGLTLLEVEADGAAHRVIGRGPPPADADPRDVLVEVAERDPPREPAPDVRGRRERRGACRGGDVAHPFSLVVSLRAA